MGVDWVALSVGALGVVLGSGSLWLQWLGHKRQLRADAAASEEARQAEPRFETELQTGVMQDPETGAFGGSGIPAVAEAIGPGELWVPEALLTGPLQNPRLPFAQLILGVRNLGKRSGQVVQIHVEPFGSEETMRLSGGNIDGPKLPKLIAGGTQASWALSYDKLTKLLKEDCPGALGVHFRVRFGDGSVITSDPLVVRFTK